MPKLLFQRHGSFRLTANDGLVIYVDTYSGERYDVRKIDYEGKVGLRP